MKISRQRKPDFNYKSSFDYGGQTDANTQPLDALRTKFADEKREAIKEKFFQSSDNKARQKMVKRTVDELMNQRYYQLVDRRAK